MEGAHHRLFEITQSVKGDPRGNALLDEVLTACFEYVLGDGGAQESLVTALNRFDNHLAGYAPPISSGLFTGTPEEVSAWAGQLTREILAHSEHSAA